MIITFGLRLDGEHGWRPANRFGMPVCGVQPGIRRPLVDAHPPGRLDGIWHQLCAAGWCGKGVLAHQRLGPCTGMQGGARMNNELELLRDGTALAGS